MKQRKIGYLLFFIISVQSCFIMQRNKINSSDIIESNYINYVDSNGYVNTGIYNKDKIWGFNTAEAAKYKMNKKGDNFFYYELLKFESITLSIYDTISFRLNFNHSDSSYYIIYDNTYNQYLKKFEIEISVVPLLYKGKVTNSIDCDSCLIYKYESEYKGGCYDWFFNDSIGFLKTYGPYDHLKTNINDWEIDCIRREPNYNYSIKLLTAIKANKNFHTRCSVGELW
ncbi:hypothetical protein ESA94_10930 [Lacibacter luteus]|uniref:Lipoprotein n=1 Tax=Lacibacter luteus TaxID=2508719 RepID=A0A4Q1CK01_9BACT|nr:hypothetical protein [Lacibacter luteus]RXK60960.1 hypothetical protein ESA94_10930 [Lacibacter luteus]